MDPAHPLQYVHERVAPPPREPDRGARANDDDSDDASDGDPFRCSKLHQPFLLWWSNPERTRHGKLLNGTSNVRSTRCPTRFRVAVVLVDVQGHSYAEAAELLEVPVGTVRSRLARAAPHCSGRYGSTHAMRDSQCKAGAPSWQSKGHIVAEPDLNCEQVLERRWRISTTDRQRIPREIEHHLEACRGCFSRAEFERHLKGHVPPLADGPGRACARVSSRSSTSSGDEFCAKGSESSTAQEQRPWSQFSASRARAGHRRSQEMYTDVATAGAPVSFRSAARARAVGYSTLLEGIPEEALASFAGVGCPFRAGVLRPGDTVLDIGSGAGTDALIAARMVGPKGKVYALDMTPAMVKKLRALAAALPAPNLEVVEANAESIPLPDASVDVVTSNGMLNLVPDKRRAIAESFASAAGRAGADRRHRHRPAGRPGLQRRSEALGRVRGRRHRGRELFDLFRDAGFEDGRLGRGYFSSAQRGRDVARRWCARDQITMRRRQPASRCSSPASATRDGFARCDGGLAGAAALVHRCSFGTLAATAALSLAASTSRSIRCMGATVLAFGLAAVIAIGAGMRKHGLPALGAALAGGAARVRPSRRVLRRRLVGFGLLGTSVFLDLHARRNLSADALVGQGHPSAT
jgi:SAM-dependent methyltransferase